MISQRAQHRNGFSLIEVLTYIVITALMLMVLFNLLNAMMRINSQLRVAHEAQQNVRLLDNVFMNSAHNTVSMTDIRPDPAGVLFYTTAEKRFSLVPNAGRITYLEESFDQVSSQWIPVGNGPITVTTSKATISNWTVAPIKASIGASWRGAVITYTLTLGDPANMYNYYQANYQMIISLR